jgi:hypothetical protein
VHELSSVGTTHLSYIIFCSTIYYVTTTRTVIEVEEYQWADPVTDKFGKYKKSDAG